MKLHLAITCALALAACPGETESPAPSDGGADGPVDSPTCALAYLGDAAADAEVEVVVLGADDALAPIADGGTAPIILPPQGGRVIFAGVRATNLDPCAVSLVGGLRDLDTNAVRFDSRTLNLDPLGDDWGGSDRHDIATFSNIPVCHNLWTEKDVYGSEFQLEVTLTDRDGKVAEQKLRVIPECVEPGNETECLCICKGGYILGEQCAGDGGTGDGGS